jgi:antitoxin VapB
MTLPAEIQIKEDRLKKALTLSGHDSLIITRRANIAWLSGGGLAVSDRMSPYSPVYLVFTPHRKYAVGYTMDLPRTMDEELAGLAYEGVSLPTFGKTPGEAALDLSQGRTAADADFLGVDDIDDAIIDLYLPYTTEEVARYRAIAEESARILTELASWAQPGMTERQVFARMWERYLENNFEGMFMFVGADERIEKYRHPVPSDKKIQDAVLLAPTGVKHGLATLSTRMVYFKQPPPEIRERFESVAAMQATMIRETRPGVRHNDLLQTIFRMYREFGHEGEMYNHFHGGPTNYRGSFPAPMQDPAATVQVNSSFAYYLTLTGVKSEDLLLVKDHGTSIASLDPDWPTLSIRSGEETISIPDILVRD